MIKINYEAETYCFKQIIEYWFEQEGILPMGGLSTLHYEKSYDLFERKNDQSTIWHKCFYKNIREDKLLKIK